MSADMNKKHPSNESLIEIRKKHSLPTPPLYHKVPIQLVRAEGQYVWDSTGRKYLDMIGGIVCISAGHNHPKIKKAMMELLESNQIQHTSLLYLSEYTINAVKALANEAPTKLKRVAFTNSGSEANELAFMAARHHTGETIVMNLRHGYHGGTSGTLAQCGHMSWRFRSQPIAASVSVEAPYCYRCPYGQTPKSCSLECAKQVEKTIQTSTHGKIAAFIAEPVMGVGGFITPPDEYFHEVARIVHNYGGKYISDEVQTGAGRTGHEYFLTKEMNLDADMITTAKGLGNGAPCGATMMSDEIAESLSGKMYFNTFGGDPYQALQAKLTIDIIKEEKLIENAREMGAMLKSALEDLMKKYPCIGEVRGRGLMVGIEFVKDPKTKEVASAETAAVMDLCKDKGVLLGKGGLFGNVIRIAPPLNVTREDVAKAVEVIEESISEAFRE